MLSPPLLQITPSITAAAVLMALVPCLVGLWRLGRAAGHVAVGPGAAPASSRQHVRRVFARALAYSCLCGFVFGWHVHEKAIIVVSDDRSGTDQSLGRAGLQ